MKSFFNIAQIVIAVLLVCSILIQTRGDGLGSAFGGSDTVVSTRRGAEKTIFYISTILSALFIGLAISRMFLE
ncbi:MAG TPA: preprotein translocase subunit SecG [Patescibacteria group bacterium]|nr:preprotein translocase subunit SecG [Patescibacteria group bacterium]